MDLIEGVGESSSPPRSFTSSSLYDVRTDVYNRLVESGHEEAVGNPDFKEELDAHFNRLPARYGLDINIDRAEDVLLHQKLLALAKDPMKRPVYHIRFMESLCTEADGDEVQQFVRTVSAPRLCHKVDDDVAVHSRERESATEFEPCSKLGDLNLDVRERHRVVKGDQEEKLSERRDMLPIHEVIFSTTDKPKLLSQLSALLSDIGLNIREAHVFSTTDGYSLDVFVVDGWPVEDTDGLYKAVEKAIAKNEGSWSGSSRATAFKTLLTQEKCLDWEIDRRFLKIKERIASGSCGDLYHGHYLGQDVAIKFLRSEHLNGAVEDEFSQEVAILREVRHENVVRFIGACTKPPHFCIVTEFMPGGSLYNYLHKHRKDLKLSQLLKFAIDVCNGMEYLHKRNIIHRDLKTANLLMDENNVVKVADFGVARFLSKGGVMTAETGTYRWMAPEVINHQPYDQKADVFSFAIVLWELLTAKVPYESMTPLQAALGVRQGLRPNIPEDAHPKLVDLMRRCWVADAGERPSFAEIKMELDNLLREIEETSEARNGN